MSAAQLPLFADVLPNGNGGFTLTPRKPKAWVGPAEAARLLDVSRTSLSTILDHPLAQQHIKWRWLSPRCGKRLYLSESLAAYLHALGSVESKS